MLITENHPRRVLLEQAIDWIALLVDPYPDLDPLRGSCDVQSQFEGECVESPGEEPCTTVLWSCGPYVSHASPVQNSKELAALALPCRSGV